MRGLGLTLSWLKPALNSQTKHAPRHPLGLASQGPPQPRPPSLSARLGVHPNSGAMAQVLSARGSGLGEGGTLGLLKLAVGVGKEGDGGHLDPQKLPLCSLCNPTEWGPGWGCWSLCLEPGG